VVLPTYQRLGLVRRAIASIFAQTQRDFELIVIDDGSTDGTGAAIAALGDSVRYQWQPNSGVAAARNAGIELAQAPLVAFIDSDNQWLPDHLAVLTEVLRRHSEAVLASTCRGYVTVGSQGPDEAEVVDALPELLLKNDVGFISGTAASREALLAAGGFDERLSVAEDSELWVRLAMRGPFAYVRRRTVLRQATLGGLKERGARAGAYLDAWEVGWPRIISELEHVERDDRDRLIATAKGNLHLIRAVRALERGDDSGARTELDRTCRFLPELSSHPLAVAYRLGQLPGSDDPGAPLRVYGTAAALWPDQRTDTALYLRLRAVLLAVRRGRLATAARLIHGWPIRATPGFVARVSPDLMRKWRRTLQDHRRRGHESPQLAENLP
jgi:GT2 family glycosyltransferase